MIGIRLFKFTFFNFENYYFIEKLFLISKIIIKYKY